MNLRICLIIFLIFFSCSKKQSIDLSISYKAKIIETIGYQVPQESVSKPIILLAGKPRTMCVKNPEIVKNSSNIYLSLQPKSYKATIPKVITPGKESYAIPRKVVAHYRKYRVGAPEVVAVKDAYIKDKNPSNFCSFGKLQGMKHDMVKCILQDRLGNLWIGTTGGGVTRYDGKYFTHYAENEGLSSNRINCILQDKEYNLWFGTNGGGINKFDGKYFTHYTLDNGIGNSFINSIIQDRDGNLWFGTFGGGVLKFDGESFTNYTQKEGLSNDYVVCTLQDFDGNIWFGTDGGGVTKFNGESFAIYSTNEGLNCNKVNSIYQDITGKIWFGTYGGGLNIFDGKIFTYITEKEGLLSNFINSIFCDHSGAFWFGTDAGLVKFNGKFFYNYTENEGLVYNKVLCIIEDQNKDLWFGSYSGGFSKYNGEKFSLLNEKDGICNNRVYSILQDPQGYFWFGTASGLSKYDGKSFFNYTEKQGFSSNRIYCLLNDKRGNLWIGDEFLGLIMYNGKTFTHFTKNEGLINNTVISMIFDHAGNLWIGTAQGLSKFDGKYFTNYTTKEGLSGNRINSVFEDSNDIIWVGTDDGGITKYDGHSFTHFTRKEGLYSNRVYCITQDYSGQIWFGTDGGGATEYNGKYLYQLTEKSGLSNNTVLSILNAKDEDLWFGTRFGLSKLSRQKHNQLLTRNAIGINKTSDKKIGLQAYPVKSFTYEDGFFGIGCNLGAIYEDRIGNIWIGANDKLITYHPSLDEIDTIPPKIQLTNLKLFNENIDWLGLENKKDTNIILGNGVVVSDFSYNETAKWYYVPNMLSLKYNNNFLTFNFIGITQKQSSKVRYQYKLEGLDKNWSTPSIQNEVSYGNLSHGSYTFKVKAINPDGYESKELNYPFTIRPPWWRTYWFKISVLLLVLLCMIIFYRWRIKRYKQVQMQLEKIVTQKTAEILEQKEEIQSQRDELETLNATKDKFFSIIAHDLRNPFNSLIGFSQVLMEQIKNREYEDMYEYAKIINQSSNSGYELLENLLNWSRSQTEKIPFTPEKIDLKVLIDANIALFIDSAEKKGINLSSRLTNTLLINADKNMILTILRNLITNAIKFSRKGDRVEIFTEKTDNYIIVHVTDTGIGIEKDKIDKLFKVDEKVKTEGTENEPGTGLGLILCKEFVDWHNGKIWVESEVNVGSKFSFALPC